MSLFCIRPTNKWFIGEEVPSPPGVTVLLFWNTKSNLNLSPVACTATHPCKRTQLVGVFDFWGFRNQTWTKLRYQVMSIFHDSYILTQSTHTFKPLHLWWVYECLPRSIMITMIPVFWDPDLIRAVVAYFSSIGFQFISIGLNGAPPNPLLFEAHVKGLQDFPPARGIDTKYVCFRYISSHLRSSNT